MPIDPDLRIAPVQRSWPSQKSCILLNTLSDRCLTITIPGKSLTRRWFIHMAYAGQRVMQPFLRVLSAPGKKKGKAEGVGIK